MKDVVMCLMSEWRWIPRCSIKFFLLLAGLLVAMPVTAASFRFLSLSDIHYDPFIGCYRVKQRPCPLIIALKKAPVSAWPSLLQAGDQVPPAYGFDTGYPLLTKALSLAKSEAEKNHVTFVWVLGDFLGHDFKKYYRQYSLDKSTEGYQAFSKKTLAFVAQQLAATFPTLDIYPILGNNDTLTRDYQVEPNGAELREITTLFAPLIKTPENRASFVRQFPVAGYYEVHPHGTGGLNILALNSILFSHKCKGQAAALAALNELSWLKSRLGAASAAHQSVFLAMHIPLSLDVYATPYLRLFTLFYLWKPVYVLSYQSLLSHYHTCITGIFSGHLHSTWFQWWSAGGGSDIAMAGTGSISPIFGNHPGFNVYEVDEKSHDVEETVTVDMTKSEKLNSPFVIN